MGTTDKCFPDDDYDYLDDHGDHDDDHGDGDHDGDHDDFAYDDNPPYNHPGRGTIEPLWHSAEESAWTKCKRHTILHSAIAFLIIALLSLPYPLDQKHIYTSLTTNCDHRTLVTTIRPSAAVDFTSIPLQGNFSQYLNY